MIHVLFIVIFSSIIFTMQSMEPISITKQRSNSLKENTEISVIRTGNDCKKEQKLKKSSSSSSSSPTRSFFSRKSSGKIESTIVSNKTEHPFIIATYDAIQNKNYSKIQFYLTDPYLDPNVLSQTDTYGPRGFTALHIVIQAKAYPALPFFLKNPCTDFTTRDVDNNLATHYLNENTKDLTDIEKAELSKIKHDAFRRVSLDEITNKRCQTLKSSYLKGEITKNVFLEVIAMIKSHIKQIKDKQGDSALPESAASFPEEYADEEFMIKKIWSMLSPWEV